MFTLPDSPVVRHPRRRSASPAAGAASPARSKLAAAMGRVKKDQSVAATGLAFLDRLRAATGDANAKLLGGGGGGRSVLDEAGGFLTGVSCDPYWAT